jgi:hypothetical protein
MSAATDLVRMRIAAGLPLGHDLALSPRVARAVAVADAVGASVLDAIDGAAAAEDDVARARRAVAVASAQTRVVAGGMVVAPMVLVPALGRLVGADLAAFYGSSVGRVVLAVGIGLLLLGGGAVVALVRRVGRPARVPAAHVAGRLPVAIAGAVAAAFVIGPGASVPVAVAVLALRRGGARIAEPADVDEPIDLVAAALTGSIGAPGALRLVAEQVPSVAAELRRIALELELGVTVPTDGGSGGLARLRAVLVHAGTMGAPPAPALRRLAADLRADELARVLAAAERLPAQLTFPTTLFLLPATVLLVGAPIVHAGLATTIR